MPFALVIDDSKSAADSLCQLLGLLGLTTRPAYGSRQAMLALANSAPDVIFLDLNMPGLNGIELLRYLKREPGSDRIPVIIISAEEHPEAALQFGADCVLTKPAALEDIEQALVKIGILPI